MNTLGPSIGKHPLPVALRVALVAAMKACERGLTVDQVARPLRGGRFQMGGTPSLRRRRTGICRTTCQVTDRARPFRRDAERGFRCFPGVQMALESVSPVSPVSSPRRGRFTDVEYIPRYPSVAETRAYPGIPFASYFTRDRGSKTLETGETGGGVKLSPPTCRRFRHFRLAPLRSGGHALCGPSLF